MDRLLSIILGYNNSKEQIKYRGVAMQHNNDAYKAFIESQLSPSPKPTFLLIGEDHQNSSALIGLAHNIEAIIKSGKNVIVITEDLKRQSTFTGGDQKYTPEKAEKDLMIGKRDPDYAALEALMNNGVKVYGLESKKLLQDYILKVKLSMNCIKKQ